METIFITGANGFLGQHLIQYFASKNFNVIASGRGVCRIAAKEKFTYAELDLTNKNAVKECLQTHQPSVIIHTAAMSKPDECNNNKEACLLHNIEATKNLTDAAESFSPHFIYISTDFVFGENGPHDEENKPAPLNFYGETKLMAETLVKQTGLLNCIVRIVFIYGVAWEGMRPSFLHWVKNNLEQNKKIKVVSDQLRTPTYVIDICNGIEKIIEQKANGIFHLAGKDILSPYQMAITVADVLRLDKSLIENVTSATFPEPVLRAKKSGLTIAKAASILGYSPVSFEEGVKLTFEQKNKN
ncbi:MAG TPA: SDR family oxidoreductase [Chitinophagaceae bacterium]|nr:SDR family oxidoreductase [Chitinophagaceae bacterium]